jgi:hypothetical protein
MKNMQSGNQKIQPKQAASRMSNGTSNVRWVLWGKIVGCVHIFILEREGRTDSNAQINGSKLPTPWINHYSVTSVMNPWLRRHDVQLIRVEGEPVFRSGWAWCHFCDSVDRSTLDGLKREATFTGGEAGQIKYLVNANLQIQVKLNQKIV